MKTVVGVFTSNDEARQVRQELVSAGFSENQIQITADSGQTMGAGTSSMGSTATDRTTISGDTASTGIMSTRGSGDDVDDSRSSHEGGISGFFARLFGSDDSDEAQPYRTAMQSGHCVVSVDAMDEDRVNEASDIMARHNPVELDERVDGQSTSRSGTTGSAIGRDAGSTAGRTTGTDWASTTGAAGGLTGSLDDGARATARGVGDVSRDRSSDSATRSTAGLAEGARIPVVEEELQVGKRQVQRGGVRVFTRVTETPVEESVNLHEEHARVERRAVNRPATEADFEAFKEGSIELRETAEQPVVSKAARVVEEVEVGKEATDRTETVRDTVRRSSVEVERIPGSETQTETDTARTTRPTGNR